MSTPLRRSALPLLAVGILSSSALAQSDVATDGGATRLRYPVTDTVPQVDDYHGTRVADPYRWLEDVDSPATLKWVAAQNELTFGYLATIPERDRIRQRLTALWNYAKYDAPFRAGKRLFWFENSGLQNQSVLYVQDSPSARPRVLLDPNTLAKDGTVALSTLEVSPDGQLLAYGTSASGSDWQQFHVRDVKTGRDRPDTLRWIKFSGMSWTRDNKGFFYSRYERPAGDDVLTSVNRGQKLYYHRLGTPQSADILIYERPDEPEWSFDAEVTEDGQYAVITVSKGTDERTRLYYIDLANPRRPKVTAPVVRLLDEFDASYHFVDNEGTVFYVTTDQGAPRKRVVAIDLNAPRVNAWRTVIPQSKDVLLSVHPVGGRLVAEYLQDARSALRLFSYTGAPQGEVSLPALGTVGRVRGRKEDDEFYYTFTSYLYPTTVFRYDLDRKVNATHRAPRVAVDTARYETRQVFYTSKDGTRVPMFVTAKKGLTLDGSHPTILYAYGGFNIPVLPSFSPATLVWLEMGGIYAVANLRGGGEYGQEWHEAGMLHRKQTVFDDFIAAAEHLVRERYTSPAKLAIHGGSNGGLLVGAVMTQRPELFGAALPAVGVLDMLRFHKFTIGWAWTSEYGSSDDAQQFKTLHAYSPLHNLKRGTRYPATLVLTADHDDRVVPGHSFKFAAALQAAQGGDAPVLIRIDVKAGHGAGKPTTKVIEEATDRFAFLVKVLGMSPAVLP